MFDIAQYHKFSMTEINDLIPYERDIIVDLIVDKMNREKKEKQGGSSIESML